MPRAPRHSLPEVVAALHAESGNVSATARRLGIRVQSLVERATHTPAIKRAIRAARKGLAPCPHCRGTGVVLPEPAPHVERPARKGAALARGAARRRS